MILLLHSQDVAADSELLRKEGITHVLNVATGIEAGTGMVSDGDPLHRWTGVGQTSRRRG